MILTDPPYAIFGSSTGVSSDVTDDRIVRPFFRAVARLASATLDTHGHAYSFCDWRSWASLWDGFRAGGLAVRNMIVWDKGSGQGAFFTNTHELVAFAEHLPRISNTFDTRQGAEGFRPIYVANVIRENRAHGADRLHNAAKPVALLERFVEASSERGGVVVDPFTGSGSTLIAADNLGRRAVVVDVEGGWCDVTVNRWQDLTGRKARRLPGHADGFLLQDDGERTDGEDTA